GGVGLDHDGDLAGSETDEVARGIDSNKLGEPADQVLVELRSVVALENGKNSIGWKRWLVTPLRPHHVVHVRRDTEHRGEIQLTAVDAFGIAATVQTKVMLEGDDWRQSRHVGCATKNFGAVDRVALHDLELAIVELVGFVENLRRCFHLADV